MAELQDTVLNAVSTMIDNAISALKVDKTITATVISCNNAVTGEYILSYNGGRITAYVTNTAISYNKNQYVHVLVPSGELSARKTIIGTAANIGSDGNLTSTAAVIDNYNLLGSNLVSASGTEYYPKGIKSGASGIGDRTQILYDSNNATTDQLRYSESVAKNNLEQAEKLLIQASFRTNLSSLHQYESKGEYSLTVGIALKDNTYSRNKYDVIASQNGYGDTYFTDACSKFRTEINAIIKNVTGFTDSEVYWNNATSVYYDFWKVAQEISNFDPECGLMYEGDIKDYDYSSGSFPTPRRANVEAVGMSRFLDILDIAEGQKVDGETIKYCTLSSVDMLGDPKSFYSYSPQYNLYDLDVENFIRIDSVTFTCDGFTTEDYPKDDIFIKDVKIYFLKEISAVNGDFKLKISQTDGNVFTSQSSAEQLPVELKLLYKNKVVNSEATFYWYKKNSLVTKDSLDYEYHGGTGWAYLGTKYSAETCYFSASDNLAYKNEYKVVAVHDATTTLSDTFILYNESAEKEVTIESSLGDTFYFDEQDPVLTCSILPEVSTGDTIKYVWNKTDDNYQTRTDYTKSADELTAERDAAVKTAQDSGGAGVTQIKRTYATQIEDASKITFLTKDSSGSQVANSQKIEYSLKDITSTTITLGCTVFILPGGVETNQYEAGSSSITLTNKKKGATNDYNITIENGSQFFQYNESGVSPAANSQGEDKIEVKSLSCKFYSPNGMELATGAYSVRWEVPTSNTLVTVSGDSLDTTTFTEYNDTKYIYNGYTFPLGIAETYNSSYTNNQIKCVITYNGEEYYKYTNLTFLKVGENGTNGTDVSVKVVPTAMVEDGKIDNVAKGIEPLCAVCDIYPQSEVEAYYHLRWNSGQSFNENVMAAQVFQKNEQIEEKDIINWTWSVAGNDSKNRMTLNSYAEGDNQEKPSNKRGVFQLSPAIAATNSLVVKACVEMYKETQTTTNTTSSEDKTAAEQLAEDVETEKEKKSYYAFLPVPVIAYANNGTADGTKDERAGSTPYTSPIRIAIDKQETLQSILYDASGLNPQYDTNKGVTLNIYPNYSASLPSGYSKWEDYLNTLKVKFYCVGGKDYNTDINFNDNKTYSSAATAAFWVSEKQDETRTVGKGAIVKIDAGGAIGGDYPYLTRKVYVRPNDNYSGKYTNNAVIAAIYSGDDQLPTNLALVEIPIHLSLNTHSLASLNAWDGNSVQINEDDEYILAPQIGAGYKTEVTDGDDLNNTTNVFTGILMGTKEENGKTKAGLYGYNLGRQCIELDAETGSAIFGLAESAASAENGWQNGRIELIPDGESKIGNWTIGSNSLYNIKWTRDFRDSNVAPTLAGEGEVPYEMMETNNLTNAEYKNVLGSKTSGILISSDPSFFSAKGATLADKMDNPLDFDSGSSEVSPGDSLEIAIDPNQNSIFTMYQHTNTADYANVEADQPFISYVTASGNTEYWYIVKRSLGENSQRIFNDKGESYTTQDFENKYANQIYTKVCVKHFDKINNTYDNSDDIQWFEFFNPINTDNGVNQYYIATLRTIQDEDSTSGRVYEYGGGSSNYIKRNTFRIRTVNGLDTIKKNLQNAAKGTESKKNDWKYSDLKNDLVWRKLPRVGIESNGRFYTNALKDQSTSMSMGKVMAFGNEINDAKYFGTNFEISNISDSETKQYFKIFIPKSNTVQNTEYFETEDNPVILSGGYDQDNEFVRPMEIYGKTLKMYAGDNSNFATMRHNEYSLTLGENSMSRFGYMKLEDDSKVLKRISTEEEKVPVKDYDTVTWDGTKLHTDSAFLDLYPGQTAQATINQSNEFTRWTKDGKDSVQSGLFIGNTPFKFWNYSAETGFYTKNFMHVAGADYNNWNVTNQASEFNALAIYHKDIGVNDSGKDSTYRVGATGDILFGTQKNLYEVHKGDTLLNAHIDDKKYDYGMWITSTPQTLPDGTVWGTKTKERGTLSDKSYVFGDFKPHDNRVSSDARQSITSAFSMLELNSAAMSYLYAGNGFVLHAANTTPDDNGLGSFIGTNVNEHFGSNYWSTDETVQHFGIDIISDSAPIMLSAVGATYSTATEPGLNYFYLQNGSAAAMTVEHNDTTSGIMSWEIQGDYGSISARAFACAGLGEKSGAGFSNNYANTTYGVVIDPGVVSPSGIFLDSLDTSRTFTDEKGTFHDGWTNMEDWREFSIYAQNGLYSKGKIRTTEGIGCHHLFADDYVHAVSDITIGDRKDPVIGLYANKDNVTQINVKGRIYATNLYYNDSTTHYGNINNVYQALCRTEDNFGQADFNNEITNVRLGTRVTDAQNTANAAKTAAATAQETANAAKTAAETAAGSANTKLSVEDFNAFKNKLRAASSFIETAGENLDSSSLKSAAELIRDACNLGI